MAGTQTVTIMFCDLVASTERRARLGDNAFDEFTRRFMAALRSAITDNNGNIVSTAGDGLMAVFPRSVADAVLCASTMHRMVAELDHDDRPRLRVGISTGEVAEDDGEYSGMPIVEAARLESAAKPGTTLVNAVVRTLVGTRHAFRFRDVGALSLKGIPEPLAAVEVLEDEVLEIPAPTSVAPAPAHRRRWPWAVAVVALVVVMAAAIGVAVTGDGSASKTQVAAKPPAGVPTPNGYTPKYAPTPCPASVTSVAADAKCAHLTVPENRNKPDGRGINLLVTSAPPRQAGPAADPTIDVCGCEDLGSSLARDHTELIHVAVRGWVDSDPRLTCPEFSAWMQSSLAKRALDPAELDRSTDLMRKCRARLDANGIDPAQYNYATAAGDILDLMYVLHIRRANFVAWSQYAPEVFGIVRSAPGAVRSITLENPPPPGATDLTDPVGDLSGAWTRFVAQCDGDRVCARGYPGLGPAARAAAASFATDPVLTTTPNPVDASRPPIKVLIDGNRNADAIAFGLGNPDTYPLIPPVVEPANETTSIATIATAVAQSSYPQLDAPWGAAASFMCAYAVHTENAEGEHVVAEAIPEFARASSVQWKRWCEVWKVPDLSAALSQPLVSDVPALFFRGDLSPIGNPNWLLALTRTLSNAQTVVFATLGNDLLSTGPPCLSALRRQFLTDPAAPLETAKCEQSSPKIQFVAPAK
jgi:class 3 adenylate cyclase/pimeloyl-ACP methyl ester carboxylesterase